LQLARLAGGLGPNAHVTGPRRSSATIFLAKTSKFFTLIFTNYFCLKTQKWRTVEFSCASHTINQSVGICLLSQKTRRCKAHIRLQPERRVSCAKQYQYLQQEIKLSQHVSVNHRFTATHNASSENFMPLIIRTTEFPQGIGPGNLPRGILPGIPPGDPPKEYTPRGAPRPEPQGISPWDLWGFMGGIMGGILGNDPGGICGEPRTRP
jgi:hypothetical protein